MSGNTWVASDPHFGHANICKFTNYDGTPLRPWDDVDEMDAALIENWNSVVQDDDRVYLLGDVAFHPRTFHRVIPQLRGRIVLIPGNHEPTGMRRYADLFDDIRGYVVKKGFIMSHIPIHPHSLSRWQLNIHGHLHANKVTLDDRGRCMDVPDPTKEEIDTRYVCVAMEQIDYTPKLLSKVLEEAKIKLDIS